MPPGTALVLMALSTARWATLPVVASLVLAAGCERGDGPGVDPGVDPGETLPLWSLEETFQTGSPDVPGYDLTDVSAVAVSRDGVAYVAESRDPGVRMFEAASGTCLGRFGREGPGPGEFERVSSLGLRGDTVWVSEPGWIHRFSPAGESVGSQRIRFQPPAPSGAGATVPLADGWGLMSSAQLIFRPGQQPPKELPRYLVNLESDEAVRIPGFKPGEVVEIGRVGEHPAGVRRGSQAFVERPPRQAIHQPCGEQVQIHITEPAAHELVCIQQRQRLGMRDHPAGRKLAQQGQDLLALPEISGCQLPYHERVTRHSVGEQQRFEPSIAPAKVIHPGRGVDQDHSRERGAERRLGTGRSPGSEAPRAASRRALSRAMSASRPAWTRAVFPWIFVNRRASASRASSMFSVVFIWLNMAIPHIPGDPPGTAVFGDAAEDQGISLATARTSAISPSSPR
jgi:hypothetical protein